METTLQIESILIHFMEKCASRKLCLFVSLLDMLTFSMLNVLFKKVI